MYLHNMILDMISLTSEHVPHPSTTNHFLAIFIETFMDVSYCRVVERGSAESRSCEGDSYAHTGIVMLT